MPCGAPVRASCSRRSRSTDTLECGSLLPLSRAEPRFGLPPSRGPKKRARLPPLFCRRDWRNTKRKQASALQGGRALRTGLRLTRREQKPAEDHCRQRDQRGAVPAKEGRRLGKQRDNGFSDFEAQRRSQIGQDVVAEKGGDDSDYREQ